MRQAAIMIASQSNAEPIWRAAVDAIASPLRWWKRRRTMVRLIDMDDHLLADIGLNRDDVKDIRNLPIGINADLVLQERALRRSGVKRYGWQQV